MALMNISSFEELVEYYVSNAAATDASAPPGYIERYIHSGINKNVRQSIVLSTVTQMRSYLTAFPVKQPLTLNRRTIDIKFRIVFLFDHVFTLRAS